MIDDEKNLNLGDESIDIKIDTIDKLSFMIDSIPHLIRYAHKCVQSDYGNDEDGYSRERELDLYNWMVRLEASLKNKYHGEWSKKANPTEFRHSEV